MGIKESISPPFVIISSSSQKPALKRMTANACIFWSKIVSANNPSIAPPNAIRTGGANDCTTVKCPGNTKRPKSENAYKFNEADSINGTNVVQANGKVDPPAVSLHLK
jgi:hypothetical protein